MTAPDEIRQLADRLDHHAEPFEDTANKLGGLGRGHANAAGDLRAAAVALRHHATLIDAVGDPEMLTTLAVFLRDEHDDRFACDYLDRIAAAVSPPPAPTERQATPISDGLEQARASARALPVDLQDAVRRSGTRATVSPPPASTCPTCGSDDGHRCEPSCRPDDHRLCPDPWHQATT